MIDSLPEHWAKISINNLKKRLEEIDFDNLKFWDFIDILKEKHVKKNVMVGNYIFNKLDKKKQDDFIKQYNELCEKMFKKYNDQKDIFLSMINKSVRTTWMESDGDEELCKMTAYIVSLGEKKYSTILKNKVPFLDMGLHTWQLNNIKNMPLYKNEFIKDFSNVFNQ